MKRHQVKAKILVCRKEEKKSPGILRFSDPFEFGRDYWTRTSDLAPPRREGRKATHLKFSKLMNSLFLFAENLLNLYSP